MKNKLFFFVEKISMKIEEKKKEKHFGGNYFQRNTLIVMFEKI